MDTQISQNFCLIEETKMEAIDSNIYEAFLESAPQVSLQLWSLFVFRLDDGNKKNASVNYLSQTVLNDDYL